MKNSVCASFRCSPALGRVVGGLIKIRRTNRTELIKELILNEALQLIKDRGGYPSSFAFNPEWDDVYASIADVLESLPLIESDRNA